MKRQYVEFTKEMKQNYTILAPDMLPIHFKLIIQVFRNYGYKMELLENHGPHIAELGLKYVHNDTCYPAILVIGQFIDALKSGKYDPRKTALILFQTGGGCRASNYIFLLRKALENAGYDYVPVISFNLNGLEKHSGFKLSLPLLHRMIYAVIYGDVLMSLINQCRPYEVQKGASRELADALTEQIAASMQENGVSFKKVKNGIADIVRRFSAIPMKREPKIRVGVVGEIYVKYSPLGNNNLEDFLVGEGAEIVVPGLLDFCLYCVYNSIVNYDLYGIGKIRYPFIKRLFSFLCRKQKEIIDIIEDNGVFRASTPFEDVIELVRDYIGFDTKMGEGWLLPAEMLELYDSGVKNIVCTQPFGCLPNHICGKGMMKPLKDRNPGMNIVTIDYDAGATKVNQENRLKLMLANASASFAGEDAYSEQPAAAFSAGTR